MFWLCFILFIAFLYFSFEFQNTIIYIFLAIITIALFVMLFLPTNKIFIETKEFKVISTYQEIEFKEERVFQKYETKYDKIFLRSDIKWVEVEKISEGK